MAGLMGNKDGREALRGAEEETVDLIAQVLTREQWAELLRAPLGNAVANGNRGLTQKLVKAGAEMGEALHAAARGGHEEIANNLLENGASVDTKDGAGYTPLHWAAQAGTTEVVQLLLLKGAGKDALDIFEFTPLFVAVCYGHGPAALALLAAGADVRLRYDDAEMSLLPTAAFYGYADIMRALIERGADVDAPDTGNHTSLHSAAHTNKVEAIDVLVEAGANIEAREDDKHRTPLHVAADKTNLEALLALLQHGAHVNVQDIDQKTPLHRAASMAGKQGAAEVVDSLLRSDVDETILNDEANAAVHVIGIETEHYEDRLVEYVDRLRELLTNAPADRAWRRRGYLVFLPRPLRQNAADAGHQQCACRHCAGNWRWSYAEKGRNEWLQWGRRS